MSRVISIFMVIIMAAALLVGCGSSNEGKNVSEPAKTAEQAKTGEKKEEAKKAEPITIKWFQFQIEVAEQVKNLAKKYNEENPNVTIEAEVMGDGYFDVLKVRAASSDMPDIFMTKGYAYLTTYRNNIMDLSDQPFTQKLVDAAKPCITLDGKILGLPAQMGGWGIIYNKKIFKDNNLEIPKTFSDMKKVAEALKAKGITPFINQFKDAWVLGHVTGAAIGRINEPVKFIQDLNAGKVKLKDAPEMKSNMDFLEFVLQYGQENPLTADWNAACTMMGEGKGAMMLEGIWVHDTIKSIDPNIELGIFGVPTTDDPRQTRLAVDVNGVWHASSTTKHADEVKKILNWIVDSKAGQDFITKECKFIPAYKGLKAEVNSCGQDVISYIESGKTSIWGWVNSPDGFENESGMVMQEYIGKKLTKEQALEKLDVMWEKLNTSKK